MGHPKLYDPVDANDIKAEAIEWVKELRRKTGTTGKLDYRLSFKHFFNITEEDLTQMQPNQNQLNKGGKK